MRQWACILVFIMVISGWSGFSLESPPPQAAAKSEMVLKPLLKHFPGFAVAVAAGDEIIWSEGFGFADLENELAVSPQDKFRVYSLSKIWTAAAAAKLVESGLLDMNAPVQDYVPTFPDKEFPITAYQLATHTSGIRHYKNDEEAYGTGECSSVENALAIFADDPLLFEPSTKRQYSTWGFVLLSAVIQGASGQSYLSTMAKEVFLPLAMVSTVHADIENEKSGRVIFYDRSEDTQSWVRTSSNASCKWGGGGFLSTAEDVVRFNAGIVGGKIIGPQLRAMIVSPDESGIFRAQGVGAGGRAIVSTDVHSHITVAILANAQGLSLGLDELAEVAAEIAKIFASEQKEMVVL